jgi:hypothetical protein
MVSLRATYLDIIDMPLSSVLGGARFQRLPGLFSGLGPGFWSPW